MHRVTYILPGSSDVAFKDFATFSEAVEFSVKHPVDCVLEIKYYENSADYRPTFWSEE
jgi:hypothetical protein